MGKFTVFENQQSVAVISMQIAVSMLFIAPSLGIFSSLIFKDLIEDTSSNLVLNILVITFIVTFLLIKIAKDTIISVQQPDTDRGLFFVFQITTGSLLLYFMFLPANSFATDMTISDKNITINAIQFIFDILLIIANASYITLSIVIGSRLSVMLIIGFSFDFIIIIYPIVIYIIDNIKI